LGTRELRRLADGPVAVYSGHGRSTDDVDDGTTIYENSQSTDKMITGRQRATPFFGGNDDHAAERMEKEEKTTVKSCLPWHGNR
jgi:hypothetical protein